MRPCVGLRNLVSRLKHVVLPAPAPFPPAAGIGMDNRYHRPAIVTRRSEPFSTKGLEGSRTCIDFVWARTPKWVTGAKEPRRPGRLAPRATGARRPRR